MRMKPWVALLGLVLLACDGATISMQGNRFPAGELAIRSDDLHTYRLSTREPGDDASIEMTGFVVQVAGAKYLNGHLMSRPGVEASGWVLFRYWFELPNRLVVVSLDSTSLPGCDASSAGALYACLQQPGVDSKVFADATTYERVSLVSTQPNNGVHPAACAVGAQPTATGEFGARRG
jgi:hypothetical protein